MFKGTWTSFHGAPTETRPVASLFTFSKPQVKLFAPCNFPYCVVVKCKYIASINWTSLNTLRGHATSDIYCECATLMRCFVTSDQIKLRKYSTLTIQLPTANPCQKIPLERPNNSDKPCKCSLHPALQCQREVGDDKKPNQYQLSEFSQSARFGGKTGCGHEAKCTVQFKSTALRHPNRASLHWTIQWWCVSKP